MRTTAVAVMCLGLTVTACDERQAAPEALDHTVSFTSSSGASAQLDVRIDKVWVFDNWSLDLYLDIQNVTNTRSTEGTQYNYNYSQSAQFEGLPIVPILGVKGSW